MCQLCTDQRHTGGVTNACLAELFAYSSALAPEMRINEILFMLNIYIASFSEYTSWVRKYGFVADQMQMELKISEEIEFATQCESNSRNMHLKHLDAIN